MPSQTQASSSEPQAGSSSLCLSPALSPLLFLFFLVSSPRAACGNNRNKGTMWWERQGDPGHGPLPAPHSVCDLRQVTAYPQCWGDRPVPPHLVCSRAGNRTQGFMLARHTLCKRNHLLSQASLFFSSSQCRCEVCCFACIQTKGQILVRPRTEIIVKRKCWW